MNVIKNKAFIYINSANRISGTSTDFLIQTQCPSNTNFDAICVLEASIPVSYYLVQDGYNTFQLQENSDKVRITVTVGNYNINSFTTALQTLLNTNSPNGWTYSLSFSTAFTTVQTALITYTVSGNSSQPSFIFGDNYLNEQFGFNYNSTVTFSSNTLVSTNVVNYINQNVLYIHSDIVDNNSNVDILQEVYASTTQSLAVATYGPCPDVIGYSKKYKGSTNQMMHFFVTDDNGIPINLNGNDWDMTLCLYKIDDFEQRVILFMQFMANLLSQNEE